MKKENEPGWVAENLLATSLEWTVNKDYDRDASPEICKDCGGRLRYQDIDEVYYCPDCGYELPCYYGEEE